MLREVESQLREAREQLVGLRRVEARRIEARRAQHDAGLLELAPRLRRELALARRRGTSVRGLRLGACGGIVLRFLQGFPVGDHEAPGTFHGRQRRPGELVVRRPGPGVSSPRRRLARPPQVAAVGAGGAAAADQGADRLGDVGEPHLAGIPRSAGAKLRCSRPRPDQRDAQRLLAEPERIPSRPVLPEHRPVRAHDEDVGARLAARSLDRRDDRGDRRVHLADSFPVGLRGLLDGAGHRKPAKLGEIHPPKKLLSAPDRGEPLVEVASRPPKTAAPGGYICPPPTTPFEGPSNRAKPRSSPLPNDTNGEVTKAAVSHPSRSRPRRACGASGLQPIGHVVPYARAVGGEAGQERRSTPAAPSGTVSSRRRRRRRSRQGRRCAGVLTAPP